MDRIIRQTKPSSWYSKTVDIIINSLLYLDINYQTVILLLSGYNRHDFIVIFSLNNYLILLNEVQTKDMLLLEVNTISQIQERTLHHYF
jgi:hypothetical protein